MYVIDGMLVMYSVIDIKNNKINYCTCRKIMRMKCVHVAIRNLKKYIEECAGIRLDKPSWFGCRAENSNHLG
jgi:hypothetical protein